MIDCGVQCAIGTKSCGYCKPIAMNVISEYVIRAVLLNPLRT